MTKLLEVTINNAMDVNYNSCPKLRFDQKFKQLSLLAFKEELIVFAASTLSIGIPISFDVPTEVGKEDFCNLRW